METTGSDCAGNDIVYYEAGKDFTCGEGTVIDPETRTATLPDGSTIRFDAIGCPNDMDRFPGHQGGEPVGEQSSIFAIADGGAAFSRVAPAE